MKKIRGENEIEAALQRLDRLTQYEGLATGAQTLQAVNKAECGSSTLLYCSQTTGDTESNFAGERVVRDIRKWLSPPDPWKNHNIIHDTQQSETGTWLIRGDTYAKWKSSGPSSLLWINGKRQYFVNIYLSGTNGHCLCSGCWKECYLVRCSLK